jgi:hypothetical protein
VVKKFKKVVKIFSKSCQKVLSHLVKNKKSESSGEEEEEEEEEEDNWYSLDQVPTTSHLVKTCSNTRGHPLGTVYTYTISRTNPRTICWKLDRYTILCTIIKYSVYTRTNCRTISRKNHHTTRQK